MSGADLNSDPGLAGERTTLAWVRLGLALVALPSALLGYSSDRADLVVTLAAAFALAAGLLVLIGSLRRQRAAPGFVKANTAVVAPSLVVGAAAAALLLEVAGLLLVVLR